MANNGFRQALLCIKQNMSVYFILFITHCCEQFNDHGMMAPFARTGSRTLELLICALFLPTSSAVNYLTLSIIVAARIKHP